MAQQRRTRTQKEPIPKLGPRMTRQRTAVVETLRDVDKFATAKDIHHELQLRGDKVGLTTVYRTLQSLAEIDAVDVLQNAEGETLYRHCLSEHHHHHLVCTKCGRSEEIDGGPIESWAQDTARAFGYTLVAHDAEIYGICGPCTQRASADSE
ncbi:Fur family transcriptional regulator [Corynebacterium sp. p3-SID1056]|uniref:Fur family transcriptional regulator n=1 Tax=Corynebacterium sp. p3-SID1056 TaxID=2916092 RepID=UPI0021A93F7A|nr:Fur family transcriptional regulator [Corynebacterium sp. p3-SID1056]MCT2339156.1 transcriptional repressor [Corynebacterium sp. p3-SID1056]